MTTTPDGSDDRRRNRRHAVEDLSGSLLFSHRCRVLDLSKDGLAVRTSAPLAPGRGYTLRLEHGERRVDLAGTVAWCRLQGTERDEEGESRPVYRAGIELGEELGEELAGLRELVEARDVADVERRISGRLELPSRAVTGKTGGERTELVVRHLSRSGLTFEAPVEPSPGDWLRLELDLDEEPLPLDVQVTGVEAAGDGPAKITVAFHPAADDARRRLDELIRAELEPGAE